MGNFGEDLRMERLARGIALEDITAVTKISQRYLVALEQEKFRLLPGGILSKGIVRGYVGALGLDPQDWTERYLKAYDASGEMLDDDRSWTVFASNVGKARILHHEVVEVRLRWLAYSAAVAGGCCWHLSDCALLRRPRRMVANTAALQARPCCAALGRSASSQSLMARVLAWYGR